MNARHRFSFGFSFLLLALVSDVIAQDSPLVAAATRAQRRPALISTLRRVPDIRTVRWFNSNHTTLRDFKGQVLLIDFWATWCRSCVSAQQELQALARELGPDGFAVVLIHSRDTKTGAGHGIDTPAENVLPKFIVDHKIFVPVAIAERNEFEALEIPGYPYYLLVDRKGFIRYNRAGGYPERAEIRELLAE